MSSMESNVLPDTSSIGLTNPEAIRSSAAWDWFWETAPQSPTWVIGPDDTGDCCWGGCWRGCWLCCWGAGLALCWGVSGAREAAWASGKLQLILIPILCNFSLTSSYGLIQSILNGLCFLDKRIKITAQGHNLDFSPFLTNNVKEKYFEYFPTIFSRRSEFSKSDFYCSSLASQLLIIFEKYVNSNLSFSMDHFPRNKFVAQVNRGWKSDHV